MKGIVIDALLAARGTAFPEDFYTMLADPTPPGVISMTNAEEGNSLFIDRDNVILTKDFYNKKTILTQTKRFRILRKSGVL
jgi:hypothetical protein